MSQRGFIAGIIVLLLLVVGNSATYTVSEWERAIVFQFGQIIRADDKPGLHFKIPFLQTVKLYDARIQTMDAPAEAYLTKEKKALVVDSFIKWRIADVAKYYVSVGGLAYNAQNRLAQIVNDGLREEFGRRAVNEVISGERTVIMDVLGRKANQQAAEYGVEVLDVRLKRVDFEKEISQSVFARMEAERARVAKERRAHGAEEAERIRADADRQREVILAEAYREAETIRGDGDAQATAVYARAFGQDQEFYSFYRSLNAYRNAFRDRSDILVLEPDSEFFRYFKKKAR